MKNTQLSHLLRKIPVLIIGVFVFLLLSSCSGQKVTITTENLPDNKLIIVGLVEYDYSDLENKSINGINVMLETKEHTKDFKLAKKYFPDKMLKQYQFINMVGDKGVYTLNYKHIATHSAEADNLLTVLDMERNINSYQNNDLQQFNLNDGKIINLGKLIVKYKGGIVENGRVNYSYNFHVVGTDTIAMHAFKEMYPLLYESCKDDVYIFKSEMESCLDYVLNNISEGKSLRIKSFIEEHPDKLNLFFKDLTPETQSDFVQALEKYSFKELDDFLFADK